MDSTLNVITESEIVTQREEWLQSQTLVRNRIQEIENEKELLKQKLYALDGAIQASNLFIQKMNTPPTTT